ncbi:transporter substrate-binding domain-containing protein [Ochrobactrum sp. BTU1]|uniref:transporter substrate-binding domain-containing protein n=1 Tax=Ochrobactrum sp. BTU1 TaxID=2840456 RepID=UPI001C04D97A|nr:transporter substrate-binding domain-containing protein [Ochrobactrum sp. BTU1]
MNRFPLCLILGLTGIFSFIGMAYASGERKLVIATEGYLRPYNFTRADGTLDGYEVELGAYLCKQMSVECTFVAQPFEGLIPGLLAGKFDAIMAGLTATSKRREVIDFSTPYSLTPQVFAVMKGGRYEKLPLTGEALQLAQNRSISQAGLAELRDAISGASVGIVKGTIDDALVKEYFKDVAEVREYRSGEEELLDLSTGRVDLVVNSRAFLNATSKLPGYEKLTMTGPYFLGGLLGGGVGVGLRKTDPELLNMFNNAIHSARDRDVIKRLSAKWFDFDVTP